MSPDDPRHGTTNGYTNQRCRCQSCKDAWAAYNKNSRKRRKSQLSEDDPRHGHYLTYLNYLCRCRPCTDAKVAYDKEHAA